MAEHELPGWMPTGLWVCCAAGDKLRSRYSSKGAFCNVCQCRWHPECVPDGELSEQQLQSLSKKRPAAEAPDFEWRWVCPRCDWIGTASIEKWQEAQEAEKNSAKKQKKAWTCPKCLKVFAGGSGMRARHWCGDDAEPCFPCRFACGFTSTDKYSTKRHEKTCKKGKELAATVLGLVPGGATVVAEPVTIVNQV